MVFPTLNPARDSYRLWFRFRMPTDHGSKDAVAVPQKLGDELLAGYTFLLGHIVLLVWWIAIIIALYISAQRFNHTHPNSELHNKIWRKRSSPYRIVILAFNRFFGRGDDPGPNTEHKPSRWFIFLWLWIAVSFVVVKYAVPIYFARYIKLGNAAPVSIDAVFVPTAADISNSTNVIQVTELYVPSALRAAGSIDAVSQTFKGDSPVSVVQNVLGVDADGETSLSIDYKYNITGLEFGLQRHLDLVLNVEGSCATEYGWLVNSTKDDPTRPGIFSDKYEIFGINYTVSKYDGPPTAKFYLDSSSIDDTTTNFSWAILTSTVDRVSFNNGTDPWYRTGQNPAAVASPDNKLIAPSIVLPRRPVLSCWESNIWSYQNKSVPVTQISSLAGDLPKGIETIFTGFINVPMIFSLGGHLGRSALLSSTTATGNIIDANSSTIYTDLYRLIFASYIGSVNALTEATLFPPNSDLTTENLLKTNGEFIPETAAFVLTSKDVETLSVKALIIIPTIVVALWVILIIITLLPKIVSMIDSFKGKSTDVLADGKDNLKDGKEEVKDAGDKADDGGDDGGIEDP